MLYMINVPSNDAATVPNYQPIACLRCVLLCAATPPQLHRSFAGLLFDFTSDRSCLGPFQSAMPHTFFVVVKSTLKKRICERLCRTSIIHRIDRISLGLGTTFTHLLLIHRNILRLERRCCVCSICERLAKSWISNTMVVSFFCKYFIRSCPYETRLSLVETSCWQLSYRIV